MKTFLHKLANDESGAALPEYAILLGLILAVAVGVLTGMGGSISQIFSKVSTNLASAAAGSG